MNSTRSQQDKETTDDRLRSYTTDTGGIYIKTDELPHTPEGREALDRLITAKPVRPVSSQS